MLNQKRYLLFVLTVSLVLGSMPSISDDQKQSIGVDKLIEDNKKKDVSLKKKSASSEEDENREIANLLGGYLCGIITNPTNDLEKEIFPAIKTHLKRYGVNNNANDIDVVRYLNANKHDLICPDTGRNFMTVAIDTAVATTLIKRTFSYNIRDLKDENGNKVSIDFNGIYFNENGEPQTLMNYIQNSMKSDRFTYETKKKFRSVAAYIYEENGARRFHKLKLTLAEKERFQKGVNSPL